MCVFIDKGNRCEVVDSRVFFLEEGVGGLVTRGGGGGDTLSLYMLLVDYLA